MPAEPMLTFAEVAKPLFEDFKKCIPANHAVIVDLQKRIGTVSAKGVPSLTAKKNESDAQKQKRKEKIAVHVVKNLISGKIDSLKKKIVAAMEPHAESIMCCFRTSKQIARFPTHLPFAKLAESFRKQGTVIASMIMSTKNGSQLSQLLHAVAFHFMVADFFDAQAKVAKGNSADGDTRRKKVSTTTKKKGTTTKKKGATTKKKGATTKKKGTTTKKGARAKTMATDTKKKRTSAKQ